MAKVVYHHESDGADLDAETFDASAEAAGTIAASMHGREAGLLDLHVTLPDGRIASRLRVPEGTGPRTYSKAAHEAVRDAVKAARD